MTQFDLFAEPAVEIVAAPETVRPAIPQPPAIVMEGTDIPDNPLGLKPLRVINADWLEVKVTDAELIAEQAKYPAETSDQYVMLKMLEQRGVRMSSTCTDTSLRYLYDYVSAPFVIRKRTEPGFAITCRQGPAPRQLEE